MPSPIKYNHNPGDQLQASTVSYLLRNTGISGENTVSGGGQNSILPPPTDAQNMADLTHSTIGQVYSHSVIYCVPTSNGYSWYKTKQPNSQAFYTMAGEEILTRYIDTQPIDPTTGLPHQPPTPVEAVGRRVVAVMAMVPGQKYILHAQNDLSANAACIWDGTRLIPANRVEVAEFIIQKFELNLAPPPYDQPLFNVAERPRVTPVLVEHEGWYLSEAEFADVDFVNGLVAQGYVVHNDGFVSPGYIPDPNRGMYFADNVYPPDAALPGFAPMIEGRDSLLNRPVTHKNPPDQGFAEAIYRPVGDTGTGEAVVMAPISSLLAYSDIVPRPNGLTYRPTKLKSVGADGTGLDNDMGYSIPSITDKPIAASFLAAKSMGLIAPLDDDPGYTPACYHMAEDRKVFLEGLVVADGTTTPTDPPSNWAGFWDIEVEYTSKRQFSVGGRTRTLWYVTGTCSPGYQSVMIYADQNTQCIPMYMRKTKVRTNNNIPQIAQLIPGSEPSSCGWIAYEYDFEEDGAETVEIPPLSCPVGTFVSAEDDGQCTWKLPNNENVVLPRQSPQGKIQDDVGYTAVGLWEFKSCDKKTGVCTWEFSPYVCSFNQTKDFIYCTGVTRDQPMAVTTQTSRAQRSYIPAISRTSDFNEILVPGMKVNYTIETVDLRCLVHPKYVEKDYKEPEGDEEKEKTHYYSFYVPFRYAVVTPPEQYHTDMAGTPNLKIVKIVIDWPTEKELTELGTIVEGDYWITTREYVSTFPEHRIPMELHWAAVKYVRGAPDIREPFGAFNDCENEGNLAVFMRPDAYGTEYACTVRMDYIPFGYALPTKTPACFYKATAEENCAPRLKGSLYDIYRQETELVVKGACYVPCSSLTKM